MKFTIKVMITDEDFLETDKNLTCFLIRFVIHGKDKIEKKDYFEKEVLYLPRFSKFNFSSY